MAEVGKFLPENIPAWQLPFWESLRNHDVRVQRCADCGTFRHVPKEICPACQSAEAMWSPIAGEGEVYTFTIVRRAPTPAYAADVPYALVHVAMKEGFRVVAGLPGIDPTDVRIGLPVRVTYDDVNADWTLLQFEPR